MCLCAFPALIYRIFVMPSCLQSLRFCLLLVQVVPSGVPCCGMAGDRGMRYPELTGGSLNANLNLPKQCSGAWGALFVHVCVVAEVRHLQQCGVHVNILKTGIWNRQSMLSLACIHATVVFPTCLEGGTSSSRVKGCV